MVYISLTYNIVVIRVAVPFNIFSIYAKNFCGAGQVPILRYTDGLKKRTTCLNANLYRKINNFHYVKNEIDKFRHLACIQLENRNAVTYDCRDVAIILRQLKFKKSQSTNTFHNERKKVFKLMFVFEIIWKDKVKS